MTSADDSNNEKVIELLLVNLKTQIDSYAEVLPSIEEVLVVAKKLLELQFPFKKLLEKATELFTAAYLEKVEYKESVDGWRYISDLPKGQHADKAKLADFFPTFLGDDALKGRKTLWNSRRDSFIAARRNFIASFDVSRHRFAEEFIFVILILQFRI
jgi:hypothetical protein